MWKLMRAIPVLLLLVALAANAEDTALESPDELQVRELVETQGKQLAINGRFDEIDRLSTEYVLHSSRTPSGLWKSGMLLGGAQVGFMASKPTTDEDWDALEALTGQWARDAPGSAAARILHAEIIENRGWEIRGGGYAHTVEDKDWQPFQRHIRRARDYLEREKQIAAQNPHYYATMLRLIKAQQGEGKPEPVLKEGIARHRGYYPMYFEMLNYLLPKWHGDASLIEQFASESVGQTADMEGASLYARIYWYAAQSDYGDSLFFTSFAHWERMKAGFEDVLKRYPDQWNVQNYAKFACAAGDFETLAVLLERVKPPIFDKAWGSQQKFQQCERLSGRISL